MKDFRDIQEGILGNIDDTIKHADKSVKRMKEIEDVKKLRYLLNDLYFNFPMSSGKFTDCNGVKIEFGDVVLCKDPDYSTDYLYGIVIRDKTKESGKFEIVAAEARVPNEDDPEFGDCVTYHYDNDHIIVLAKKKNAKKMLELLIKLYN